MSHPAWVCGLKHRLVAMHFLINVTPCVGVWIETAKLAELPDNAAVTPCVGVWIETYRRASYPLLRNVTPCVGVWIETRK